MSLFCQSQLDNILLQHCDLIDDFPVLRLVNRHYNNLIQQNDAYQCLQSIIEAINSYTRKVVKPGYPDDEVPYHIQLFLASCTINDKYPMYIYLLNKYADTRDYKYDAFMMCCCFGNLRAAGFFYETFQQLFLLKYLDLSYSFDLCCISRKVEVAKWLLR